MQKPQAIILCASQRAFTGGICRCLQAQLHNLAACGVHWWDRAGKPTTSPVGVYDGNLAVSTTELTIIQPHCCAGPVTSAAERSVNESFHSTLHCPVKFCSKVPTQCKSKCMQLRGPLLGCQAVQSVTHHVWPRIMFLRLSASSQLEAESMSLLSKTLCRI